MVLPSRPRAEVFCLIGNRVGDRFLGSTARISGALRGACLYEGVDHAKLCGLLWKSGCGTMTTPTNRVCIKAIEHQTKAKKQNRSNQREWQNQRQKSLSSRIVPHPSQRMQTRMTFCKKTRFRVFGRKFDQHAEWRTAQR